ncbi:NAD-dependent epimerase/dehydratase family protein [Pontimicrobium sp. MEBiC01747]
MILVTGGTGLVGAHLLYRLASEKQQVRAIYRNEKTFKTVKRIFSYYSKDVTSLFNSIEWVKANLNDIPALTDAFKDITHVYHCAALVSFEPNKFDLLQKTNIEGTATIVNLCISNNIKKLCYVSSIAALGQSINNTPISETSEWNNEAEHDVYAISKYGAELEVWRGTQEGVNAVIVNPGVIIGPGIWKYGSGSLITTVHKGLKYYTSGSSGFVGIYNVIDSMVELMNSNIKNERFILVSNTWSYKQFLTTCANNLQVEPPKKEATNSLLQIGWRLDWLKHKLTGKRRKLTKQLVKSLSTTTVYDNSKLKSYIDIKSKPLNYTIKKVCDFYLKDIN